VRGVRALGARALAHHQRIADVHVSLLLHGGLLVDEDAVAVVGEDDVTDLHVGLDVRAEDAEVPALKGKGKACF
jgi:hypothetical protein